MAAITIPTGPNESAGVYQYQNSASGTFVLLDYPNDYVWQLVGSNYQFCNKSIKGFMQQWKQAYRANQIETYARANPYPASGVTITDNNGYNDTTMTNQLIPAVFVSV